jgi:hypothetical protein
MLDFGLKTAAPAEKTVHKLRDQEVKFSALLGKAEAGEKVRVLIKDLMSAMGVLIWTSRILRTVPANHWRAMSSYRAFCRSIKSLDSAVAMTTSEIKAFRDWAVELIAREFVEIGSTPEHEYVRIYTDASTAGFGAILWRHGRFFIFCGTWNGGRKEPRDIPLLELRALDLAITHFRGNHLLNGDPVIVWVTDSETGEFATAKGMSPVYGINTVVGRVAPHIHFIQHIPTDLNPTDELSKGKRLVQSKLFYAQDYLTAEWRSGAARAVVWKA